MFVGRAVLSSFIILLGLVLISCSAPETPTLVPLPTGDNFQPTSAPPTETATEAAPQLLITLLTPTPVPVYPTLPPPLPTLTPLPGETSRSVPTPGVLEIPPGPMFPPRASEIGNTQGDAALVAILRRCWNVSDTHQLNGGDPAQRAAFECARPLLLGMITDFPGYALVHRVLAWGYFYKDNDVAKAVAEYRTAAQLYQDQGNRTGESEARMRLALLLISGNEGQGCDELAKSGTLDPTNARALDYYSAFKCEQVSGPNALPAVKVDLGPYRGKIVFKSDRDGFPSSYVMDADGQNVQKISSAVYNAAAQWESFSPDRTQVATVREAGYTNKFGFNNDIWVTDPSGGSGRGLENPANDYDPVWSPVGLFDGRAWIAFVSNRGDSKHPDNGGEEIWIMHDDGTSPFRLTCHGPKYSKHPSWSPDAGKLVFYSNYPGGNNGQIFVMNLAPLGSLQENCQLGDAIQNISNNGSNESEPIWVK